MYSLDAHAFGATEKCALRGGNSGSDCRLGKSLMDRNKNLHVALRDRVVGAAEVEGMDAFRDERESFVEIGFKHGATAAGGEVEGDNDRSTVRGLAKREAIVSE